jgi:GTPase Era involved in 16S rRNA processing
MAKEVADEDIIQEVIDRLQEKFPETSRAEIDRIARAEFEELSGRPVRSYLAILVERSSKKRLKKTKNRE